MTRQKRAAFVIASVLGIWIATANPPEGLNVKGMRLLGILVWWIITMCVEAIPAYVSCVAACALIVICRVGETEEVFSAFSGSTCWLLIGAYCFAAGLKNSGIIRRIALNIMRLFPGTYRGQVLGMAFASILVSPCIPSSAAKGSILIPLSNIVSDEMGYAPHSRETVGLFTVTALITLFGGLMFLTGGILVTSMLSISNLSVTWGEWLKIF